jgi:hypothetical protein
MRFKSKHKPNTRYLLAYDANPDSWRTHLALPYGTQGETHGDGNIIHTGQRSICTLADTLDLIASTLDALRVAVKDQDVESVDEIRSGLRCSFRMQLDEAKIAMAHALKGKPIYLHNREVVTGAKWANRRDADLLPTLDADASSQARAFYLHALVTGAHPSMLELFVSATEIDRESYKYNQIRMMEQQGFDNSQLYQQADYAYRQIMRVSEAFTTCHRFTQETP